MNDGGAIGKKEERKTSFNFRVFLLLNLLPRSKAKKKLTDRSKKLACLIDILNPILNTP